MRGLEVELGSQGNDASRVQTGASAVVALLVKVDPDRLSDTWRLVQVADVAPEVGIVDHAAQVALEVPVVHRVEPDQGGEQANVGQRDPVPDQKAVLREPSLDLVQGLEQGNERPLVGLLGACKAAAVNAVVDLVVDPRVDLVDLLGLGRRIEIAVGRAELAEFTVQHLDDLRGLVADDRSLLSIPEHRNRRAPRVRLARHRVEHVERKPAVGGHEVVETFRKPPAVLVAAIVRHGHADDVAQTLEVAHDDRAMGPRAVVGDPQVISTGFRREGRAAVLANPVSELGPAANEVAGVADPGLLLGADPALMTQAVILAGGKGTRLAAVSGGLPKPLTPVAGVPVVERQIELLVRYGIREIFLTTGYRARTLEEQLGDGARLGARLHHVREDEPLGTAGGVAALRDRLEDAFLVLYGDVVVEMDLARLLRFHVTRGADATIVVHPNDHPFDSDLVELGEDGVVRGFHPAPRAADGPDLRNQVSAALYVVEAHALVHIEPRAKQDFVRDVFPRMLGAGAALFGYHTTEYLKDMGTPDRLERVERDIRAGVPEANHASRTRPALFLDRDGVINREIDGVHAPDRLELLPGTGDAIRRLNRAGWLVAGVTNQPDVAKGFLSDADLEAVHRRLETRLGAAGAWLDGLVHCPHHPDRGFVGERPELKISCDCRKPRAGMLEELAARLPIDHARSALVGDSWRDMAAAHAFGIGAIGVRTGHGLRAVPPDAQAATGRPDVIVDDLAQAVSLVLAPDPGVERVAREAADRIASDAPPFDRVRVAIAGADAHARALTAFRLRHALAARGVRSLWVRLEDWSAPARDASGVASAAIRTAVEQLAAGQRVAAPGVDPVRGGPLASEVVYDPKEARVLWIDGAAALELEGLSFGVVVERGPRAGDGAPNGAPNTSAAGGDSAHDSAHEGTAVVRLSPMPLGAQEGPGPSMDGSKQ